MSIHIGAKPKALVTIKDTRLRQMLFSPRVLEMLGPWVELDFLPVPPNEEDTSRYSALLRELIGDYDICLTGWGSPKLDADVLAHAKRLRYVGHTAGSLVPVMSPEAYDRGIVVANANEALARSTAECALALMLAGAWRLQPYADGLRRGLWSNNYAETVPGLHGQNIGIVGLGSIAREVIRLLRPLGAKIHVYSGHCTAEEAEALGVKLAADLDELLRTCGIVSLHATLTARTRGMIGERELAQMQDGALLVNTSRGEIVREPDLVRELATGRIYAALDVFEEEPLPDGHPLLRQPNALCVPHIGGFARYWKTRLAKLAAEDLIRWLQGEPPARAVTREQYRLLSEY